jgi:hypothetical protein
MWVLGVFFGLTGRGASGNRGTVKIVSEAFSIVRVIALLSLMFGVMGLMLLDGQVFTHAMVGIFCGIVAAVCGVVLTRRGGKPRWTGWIFAILGLTLAIWCGIESPSAYRFQDNFNKKSREHREKMEREQKLRV